MELKEMIKVMEHFKNGGEVECSTKGQGSWETFPSYRWNWRNFDYRIKEPKQNVTIEKWLIKNVDSSEHFIMESSDVDLTLKDFPNGWKVKLIESYEVEL